MTTPIWPFSPESAAILIARTAWPFDSQVEEWAPDLLGSLDPTRSILQARQRLESAIAAVLGGV